MDFKQFFYLAAVFILIFLITSPPANATNGTTIENSSNTVSLPTQLGSTNTIDGFGIVSPHLRVGWRRLPEMLDAQQRMGVGWAREEIPWRGVELEPEVFRWAYEFDSTPRDFEFLLSELEQRNIEMVALLTYDPWYLQQDPAPEQLLARWEGYVRGVVDKFGDRIDYWEIGNEMNSRGFWGKVVHEPDRPAEPNPELYAKMLQLAHQVIKEHDQEDVVILGGLIALTDNDCPTNPFEYLRQLHAAGAWDAFDAIGFHPYWGENPPEAFIPRGRAHDPISGACQPNDSAEYNLIGEVRAVRDLAARFGEKPIWITEIGWEQSWLEAWAGYRGTDPNLVEADYLVRTYVPLLSEPRVEKVFWYTQVDDPGDAAGQFRLDEDGQQALGNLSTLLTGSTPLGQVQGQDDQGQATDEDVYEYRFAKEKQLIIVIWKARGGDTEREVTIRELDVETIRSVNILATDLSPEASREQTVEDGTLTIQLSERPLLLLADVPSSWESSLPTTELDSSEWQKSFDEWSERQQEEWARWFDEWSQRQQEEWARWFEEQQKKMEREIEEEIQRQLCGTAMLPFGMILMGGVFLRRRKPLD